MAPAQDESAYAHDVVKSWTSILAVLSSSKDLETALAAATIISHDMPYLCASRILAGMDLFSLLCLAYAMCCRGIGDLLGRI